jgi:RNA polymerase sigma-70 factor (ECF subfamily)
LNTTDADLLPRCRGGDEAAWRELVALHTRKVFGLAYRFPGRVDEAEDLTQEVFVKVYQTLGRYRESDGPFGGWLMAVARNHAIDHYRRRKQERLRRADDPAVLDGAPAREEHPMAGLEREERRHLVHSGCVPFPGPARPTDPARPAGLPRGDRERARDPPGTVKSRINRARIELAKRLLGRHRGLAGDAP